METELMIIAVDFDGTCVTHEYPRIGRYIGAEPVLRELVKAGHQLILLTMRGDKLLDEATNWFKDRDIPLFAINENPEQKSWTNSKKVYAHLYIEDAALGAPLSKGLPGERDYINWGEARRILVKQGILK
jgi:hypothetical protein